MNVSVVVPVYNSEASLPLLVNRLQSVLSSLSQSYEVILVNDGSRDGSWRAVMELAAKHPCVTGINMMRNYGQHNALLCGIRHARHGTIVTIDDDLQHPPEEIPQLLAELEKGYDVVYGTPKTERHGIWRDLASRITKMALKASMGVDVAEKVSAFRAFRTKLRIAFEGYKGSFVSIDVLLTWGTTRFAAVPVRQDERPFGESNYTFKKLVTHAMNMVTGFSVLPLQLASLLGFGFTLVGGALLLYVVGRFLLAGQVVPGFAFLASSIAIFSGAQLFCLGIIGEYLARMHFRTMDKPSYAVRTQVPCVAEPVQPSRAEAASAARQRHEYDDA